jgi:amidase
MIRDPWLASSIMAKRGVARGAAGQRREPSIAAQGAFHYVYGPYAKPVLTIEPGDVVAVETEDAFGGVITAGRIRLGNMVDPKYAVGASILKKYLVS